MNGLSVGVALDLLAWGYQNNSWEVCGASLAIVIMLLVLAKFEISDQVEWEVKEWEAKFKYKKGDD